VAEADAKILIVEDDLDVADMLNSYFRNQKYEVFTVNWGEDAVRSAQTALPDLIILDIRLPDIDGFEVARRLRANRKTSAIPIIFLTEKRDRADRLEGLELGADDYITKPFDVMELKVRVRNSLRRSTLNTLTSPVTGLPEGELVTEQLEQFSRSTDAALLLVSLDHIDAFRDSYGFVASDDVLRAVSQLIQNGLREAGNEKDFLGHLDSADFLLVTSEAVLGLLQDRIRARLEQSLDYFYPLKDREAGVDKARRLGVRMATMLSIAARAKSAQDIKALLLSNRS
jgi:DNA-binding response OmpR family regulator